jgi:hypothetical protein
MREQADLNPSKELVTVLGKFRSSLEAADPISALKDGLIGSRAKVDGPFGLKDLVYADYVASGRALRQVEQFVLDEVLPYYANSHTEASYCGGMMTRLRREARSVIKEWCGADSRHAAIFAGSGATAGLNRLVHLLGITDAIAAGRRVCVIVGPYEHHSNILPWRESGAEIVEIPEGSGGGPDLVLSGRGPSEHRCRPDNLLVFSRIEHNRDLDRRRRRHQALRSRPVRQDRLGLCRRRTLHADLDDAGAGRRDRRDRGIAAQVPRRPGGLRRADRAA